MALFQDDFWPALFRGDVGCEAIADSMPSRSAHIASCFLELEKLNQELRSKLRDDFINILNGMGSISLSSTPQLPSPSSTPPSRSSPLIHDTSFITEAYTWLLENIANPYPSSKVKTSLAQRYNSPLSAINSWFINARRRMGWTALCRDSFNNCRADALDAAYRALVEEDPNRQLPPDITHAFISVKVAAEGLYSSTLTKSALAGDLETAVNDMSEQDNVPANKQKCCGPRGTIEFSMVSDVDSQNQTSVAQDCYPSPDHSPSSSLVPALDEPLTDESEGHEVILPPTLAGRKRRLSSSEAAQAPMSESTPRLVKRPRRGFSSSAHACLPSPATSAGELLENDQIPRSVPVTQSFADSTTRKRRLSDADADAIRSPKRPREWMAGPRPNTVSEPFPLSTLESDVSIDEWFKTNFDALFALPPPVDVVEPDLSTQWEIELFNNYSIPENPQKVFTPPIQDNQILSSSTDLTALDDLLQSLETGGFVAPPEIMQPPTMASFTNPVSQGLPLLPDLSQTIDWTALFNEDPAEPTCDPMFPQSYVNPALPDIDLSALQLPHVWTTVTS
ncbi:putative mating-type protein beta [Butyriboletus roseoflavus]|nr:putative mating-type protein beta [Butyriboletus roseoflavus]